jgi:hypothetical protein
MKPVAFVVTPRRTDGLKLHSARRRSDMAAHHHGDRMQKLLSTLFVLLIATVTACSSGDRIGGPFGAPTYVLVQRNGEAPPIALDADTVTGTAHYSLAADTIRVDTRASQFVETYVQRLDYIGSSSPPMFQRGESEYQFSGDATEGTAVLVCLPIGAPCAFITLSFNRSSDSLVLTRNDATSSMDVYRRIR